MRRKLAAGNWKMNGLAAGLAEVQTLAQTHPNDTVDILLCPPATLLDRMSATCAGSAIKTGGQDCHMATTGAHTGDTSAQMLADAGAGYVILGHSERRTDHAESDGMVHSKTKAAWDAGLVAIVCVGETEAERTADKTLDIIAGQMSGSIPNGAIGVNLVVAYEPVWAIGTGLVPTLDQIGEVHDFMRTLLIRRFGEDAGQSIRLLYGGSVKPANATEIFDVSNVDGALVGGASLKAADFSGIITALEASV
ncbi:triose-phosphate isomerase [Algirhabdus cladophorae]|uniref:triose-phosphate isomerase n=1 Tax=Algirhabdus cladophorae TaxID=3377108 RepID=UPI003B849673